MSSTAPQLRSRLPRIAEVAVQRARLTVVPRPRTRPRAPRVPFVTLVSVIMLGGVVGLLLFNTSMQQASFRATALEEQAAHLTAQEEALRMELQELRDPQRVAAEAQDNGMVLPAGGPLVLPLGSGEVLGDEDQPVLPGGRLPEGLPGPRKPAVLDPDPVIERRDTNRDTNRDTARDANRDTARDTARDTGRHGESGRAGQR